MSTPPIPQTIVEAAARALHDVECHDRSCSMTGILSAYGHRANAVVAALGVCEVREEWRHSGDGSPENPGWWTNQAINDCGCPPVRRMLFAAPAEPVEDEGAPT